jgi:hypothetical protein
MHVIALFIALIMSTSAFAGEIIECEVQRVTSDGREWHYRTKVDGRPEPCWYVGQRMKPRNELRWPSRAASEAAQSQTPISPRYGSPAAAPELQPVQGQPPSQPRIGEAAQPGDSAVISGAASATRGEVMQNEPAGSERPRGSPDNTSPASSFGESMAQAPRLRWPKEPPLWLYPLVLVVLVAGAGLVYLNRRPG